MNMIVFETEQGLRLAILHRNVIMVRSVEGSDTSCELVHSLDKGTITTDRLNHSLMEVVAALNKVSEAW